ncbi:LysR family transcriptional regulator [Erwinia mallotivora]|uniref:LysR family transcriptional regulator n=1 Tax=Erwinia mallotivora TaxID=69222 RepID=UPI0035E57768
MHAGRLPNLKLLTIFTTVVCCQGYSRAQQALNMTTPAISGYMSELEHQLGFILCQRGRSGFALTPKGEQFLHYCHQLQATLGDFASQVDSLKAEQGGIFSVGVVDSTTTDRELALAGMISQFSERFPAVYLNLTVNSPNELQQQELDNRLDLAIGHFPVNVSNLLSLPLHDEQHWLYCSNRHPLYAVCDEKTEELAGCGFVTRSYWNAAELSRRGFKVSAASVESMEAQLILILSGRYIDYLPEHYARSWVEQGQLRTLLPQQFSYRAPFSLIFRRGRSRETLIRAFRDLAKLRAGPKE